MLRLFSIPIFGLLTLCALLFEIEQCNAGEDMPCTTRPAAERDIPIPDSIAKYNECVKLELREMSGSYRCDIDKLVGIVPKASEYLAGEMPTEEPHFSIKIEEIESNSAALCERTRFDPGAWGRCFNNFRLKSTHSLIRSAESPTPFQFDSPLGSFRLFIDGRFTASMSGLFLKGAYVAVGRCTKAG